MFPDSPLRFRLPSGGPGSHSLTGPRSATDVEAATSRRRSAAVIAQILLACAQEGNGEGVAAAGELRERLGAAADGDLPAAFAGLSQTHQASLRRRFGSALDELFALAQETDHEFLFMGLVNLAQRLQQQPGTAGWVATIFQCVARGSGDAFGAAPAGIRAQAQAELDAMQGVGSAGRRFEFLARNFAREASDPAMILGMGVAATAFSAVRLGILSRLAVRPAAWWTRGLVAAGLANGAAFGGEVVAFWGSTRAYGQLVRPETLRWDRATIGHELASLALTLGLLKLSGAAAEGIFDRVHGINALTGEASRLTGFTAFSRQAFNQVGMFGGIAAGHWAEARLGLRPQSSGDTFWTDSLVTLLQFNVGGRLSQEALGPAHAARLQAMALRVHALDRAPLRPGDLFPGLGSEAALTPEGLRFAVPEREDPRLANAVFMSSMDPKDKPGTVLDALRPPGAAERPRDPESLATPFESLFNIIFTEEMSVEGRYQVARELLQDLGIARRNYVTWRKARLQSGSSGSDPVPGLESLDQVFHRVNKEHFEVLSDQMQGWNARFEHLQRELRNRVNNGAKSRRREIRRLLESVQLKLLETRRYHNDAESYLGDDKGPGSKSVFSAENYGRLAQRFTDISLRLERYVQEKQPLQKLLAGFRPELSARRVTPVERLAVEAEIRRSTLSPERQDLLRQALDERDPLLSQQDQSPLYRWLSDLNAMGPTKRARRAWRSLGAYLEVSAELRRSIPVDQLRAWEQDNEFLTGPRYANYEKARNALIACLSMETGAEAAPLAERYLDAARPVAELLANYRPQPRRNVALKWGELREQLLRLADRQFLNRDTVLGLLEWFDPHTPPPARPGHAGRRGKGRGRTEPARPAPEPPRASKPSNGINAIREEAIAGLIDFLRKGTHSREVQQELSGFIGEVVRRRDTDMMSMLAIYLQNYQLGMMRDRIQIRSQPSPDTLSDQMAVEAHDRFLEAMRNTANFYLPNKGLRGPFFEVFEKLEGGKEDNNARLAMPILHRTRELLDEGYSVRLMSRGGLGEAILFGAHEDGRKRTLALSSVLEPLMGREHLEHWLDRAERELLHNGEYLQQDHGKHPLSVSLHLYKIRSGVSKRDLSTWARDYLENHPTLEDIQLIYPKTGNEAADPFDATFYRIEPVPRGMATTEALIENRVLDLTLRPEDLSNRIELFRLRQERVQYLLLRNPGVGNMIQDPRWRELLATNSADLQANIDRLRGLERELLEPGAAETSELVQRELQISQTRRRETRNAEAAAPQVISGVIVRREGSEPPAGPPDPETVRENLLRSVLRDVETTEARLQRNRLLREAGEQIMGLQSENWDLLRESLRMFPQDAGLRSLGHRVVMARSQELERRNDQHLTEPGPGNRVAPRSLDLETRRRIFHESAQMVLGVGIAGRRVPQLLDLSQVGFSVGNLRWTYGERGLTLQGYVTPDPAREPEAAFEVRRPGRRRAEEPDDSAHEPASGFFSIRLTRESRSGGLQIFFDTLTLPHHRREQSVGTVFYRELVRFARQIDAKAIVTPDVSGDHRYSLAVYGIRFRNEEERRRLMSPFQVFLGDYMMKLPELSDYDISALAEIRTPRDIALARLDPATRTLRLDRAEINPSGTPMLPDYYQVGRLFLLNDSPSYYGIFEVKDGSYSMRVFNEYLVRRLGRPLNGDPQEN